MSQDDPCHFHSTLVTLGFTLSSFNEQLDAAAKLHRDGRLAEAAAEYRRLRKTHPREARLYHLLGLATAQLGQPDEGAKLIQNAINLQPRVAVFHENMGYVVQLMNRHDVAVKAYRNALQIDPSSYSVWFNLGQCLIHLGNDKEASQAFERALALKPDYADALNGLGTVFQKQNRIDEALASFQKAVEINPKYAAAQHSVALALADSGRLDEAMQREARVLELAPEVSSSLNGRIYMAQFHPGFDRAAIQREMEEFNRRFGLPLANHAPHTNDRDPDRRLKIGYVSPTFYFHSEVFFVLPLLREHDHANFEIHCYSEVEKEDEFTAQVKKCADAWHDSTGNTDEQLADRIRADGIDLLIDLTMHMRKNRLGVFARKPAPVQATWLAYPGGTGLTAMDYRLTDAHMDPPDCDHFYSEISVRLPDCWVCYDPMSEIAIAPGAKRDFVRFASLNNPRKINENVLRLWRRVLKEIPGSRLLLLVTSQEQRRNIARFFDGGGVDASRIQFTGYLGRAQYLALHNEIDLFLDPFPYNGITTMLDALWMGAATVSLIGQTAPGRAGLGILTMAGFPQWTAASEDEYVEIARRGCAIPREEIRRRFCASPLMDHARFARNMEDAYRWMWRQYAGKT